MSKNKIINITDFSEFPGARYKSLGPHSGEEFRDDVLLKAINKYGENITINLDGALGYGSSFLEEVFGGLVRNNIPLSTINKIIENLICTEDPSLRSEIEFYVEKAKKDNEDNKL